MGRNWLVFLWSVIGAVIGQLLGTVLANQWPVVAWLNKGLNMGFSPTNVDLGFVILTLGLALKLSIAGAIGLVLSLWLALRNA